MTRGRVLILGPVENEIGSGMTGGELFVCDPRQRGARQTAQPQRGGDRLHLRRLRVDAPADHQLPRANGQPAGGGDPQELDRGPPRPTAAQGRSAGGGAKGGGFHRRGDERGVTISPARKRVTSLKRKRREGSIYPDTSLKRKRRVGSIYPDTSLKRKRRVGAPLRLRFRLVCSSLALQACVRFFRFACASGLCQVLPSRDNTWRESTTLLVVSRFGSRSTRETTSMNALLPCHFVRPFA